MFVPVTLLLSTAFSQLMVQSEAWRVNVSYELGFGPVIIIKLSSPALLSISAARTLLRPEQLTVSSTVYTYYTCIHLVYEHIYSESVVNFGNCA